jgi:S-ribosylhomocysteine lyase LuxS involved in autoinducer biosynthesis
MDCGNYREHNLVTCKWEIRLWKQVLENAKPENLVYPPREK